MRKIIFAVLLALGTLPAIFAAPDLKEFLTADKAALWQLRPAEVGRKFPVPAKWNNQEKTELRYSAPKTGEAATFDGKNITEAIFKFKDGVLSDIYISLYNRGDDGKLEASAFQALRSAAEETASRLTGVPPGERDRRVLGGAAQEQRVWKSPEMNLALRWSSKSRVPEYLNILIVPPGVEFEQIRSALKADADVKDLPSRVKTDARNGVRYLEVPMIDQGSKGYCAAASIARVMRYFGSEVDQHVIAQLAKTDAATGTQWAEAANAIEKARSRLGVKLNKLYECDSFKSYHAAESFIAGYNNVARSMKQPRLKIDDYVTISGNTRTLQVNRLQAACDQEVLKAFRLRERKDFKKFKEAIADSIARGLPLLWLIPSHMRLIIGCGEDKVVYSDSYGARAEMRTMSYEDAWTITYGVLQLVP